MEDVYIEYPKEEWHVEFKSGRVIRYLVDSVYQLIHFKSLTEKLHLVKRIHKPKRVFDKNRLLAC